MSTETLQDVEDMSPQELAAMAAASEREYVAEMSQPPKPAVGTEGSGGGATIEFEFGSPGGTGNTEAKEDYKPFADVPDDIEGKGADEVLLGMTISEMLDLRFGFEAMLCAQIDGDATEDDYMPSEFEQKMYKKVYAKYEKVAAEKLPDWLWIVMVEAMFTGRRFYRAFKAGKINRRNKKAAQVQESNNLDERLKDAKLKNEQLHQIKSMVDVASKLVPLVNDKNIKGKRTNFKIFSDGTYHYCRQTDTQKAVYVGQNASGRKPEKVDLTNLQHVKEVIAANGWGKLQRAFDLPENWAQSKGIDINNLGLDSE